MTPCAICRLAIHDDGTVFQAFGRPLFPAHDTCAPVIHAGVRLLGVTALQVGREALMRRAPTAFAVLESARTVVQRLQAPNAPPAPPPRPQVRRQWSPPENVIDVQAG